MVDDVLDRERRRVDQLGVLGRLHPLRVPRVTLTQVGGQRVVRRACRRERRPAVVQRDDPAERGDRRLPGDAAAGEDREAVLADPGRVRARRGVRVRGINNGDDVEITQGLTKDDMVITTGAYGLDEGTKVKVGSEDGKADDTAKDKAGDEK